MSLVFRNYEENDFSDLRDMVFCLYAEDPVGAQMTDKKILNTIREVCCILKKYA